MNFNPNVIVNPPIIHRRVNDIHRVFITEQPHIIEDQTRIFNHHILRHTCCVRPMCCEFNDCQVQNCCPIPGIGMGCCPGPIRPRPFEQGPQVQRPPFEQGPQVQRPPFEQGPQVQRPLFGRMP